MNQAVGLIDNIPARWKGPSGEHPSLAQRTNDRQQSGRRNMTDYRENAIEAMNATDDDNGKGRNSPLRVLRYAAAHLSDRHVSLVDRP